MRMGILGYPRIFKYTDSYTWIFLDIPEYTEVMTPKIFTFQDIFLMFEYAHITSYPVVKSEKNEVKTIHLVNSVCTSIYKYIL
jgi:hypothetical protein